MGTRLESEPDIQFNVSRGPGCNRSSLSAKGHLALFSDVPVLKISKDKGTSSPTLRGLNRKPASIPRQIHPNESNHQRAADLYEKLSLHSFFLSSSLAHISIILPITPIIPHPAAFPRLQRLVFRLSAIHCCRFCILIPNPFPGV